MTFTHLLVYPTGHPVVSRLFISQAREDGESGRPYIATSGSYQDWEKGRDEFNRRGNGGSGDCLGKLLLVLAGLGLVIFSIPASILSGALMLIIFRVFSVKISSDKPHMIVFGAAFWATFSYLATAVILTLLEKWIWKGGSGWRHGTFMQSLFKYFLVLKGQMLASPETLAKFHLSCIVVAAIVLYYMLWKSLSLNKGYVFILSLLSAAFIILPSFIAILLLMVEFMPAGFEFVLRLF